MKKTARRCAARQDRNRAPRPQPAGTLFGVKAHRSVCCPRLGPPVAPAKSGTKTNELRAALGSASRRRHRTRQTRAPVEIMSASRFNLIPSRRVFCRPSLQYWPRHSTRHRNSSRLRRETRDRELAPARRNFRQPGKEGEAHPAMHAKETAKVRPGFTFRKFPPTFPHRQRLNNAVLQGLAIPLKPARQESGREPA